MDLISSGLESLGFGKWFQDQVDPQDLIGFDVARVMAVHKEGYIINNGETDVPAELIGKMVFHSDSPIDLPAAGDWVLASFYDKNSLAIIHKVLPRKSLLKRKTPGKKIDFQLIAANIDVAFIVQSLDVNFNIGRLERYLVMVQDSNIEPVVLLSKSDLVGERDVAEKATQIHELMPSLKVLAFSNANEAGLKDLKDLLRPKKTYCLLGSSGVGKTTLLNNLMKNALFATRRVRKKDGKGRHTTTARQLTKLACEAILIDTPGMRELGNFSVDAGIDETFTEIARLSHQCQFNDCSHENEMGCAVLRALEDGQITENRYRNYLKMKKESAYHEMSYLEKRKKDKQFGKHIKTVMMHKKNRR